eukprot:3237081-Pyramimonas_sp.AAC.1
MSGGRLSVPLRHHPLTSDSAHIVASAEQIESHGPHHTYSPFSKGNRFYHPAPPPGFKTSREPMQNTRF